MKFKGVELYPKPTFGAVQDVEDVLGEWILSNIPLKDLDVTKDLDVALQDYAASHPDYFAKQTAFQKRMENVRLVMLCTNLTRREVEKLQRRLSYEDYKKLLEECKAIINAPTVDDFLERLKSDTSTPPDETRTEQENHE